MNDSEKIAELMREVRELNVKNYCVWEALHWLDAARRVACLYEQGKSEEANELINKEADYSRRFEARYIE